MISSTNKRKTSFYLILGMIPIMIALTIIVLIRDHAISHAPTEIHPQIRIIRIHFSDTSVSASDLGNSPGAYKANRDLRKQGGFHYRVVSGENIDIAQGFFPDPRVIYFDAPTDDSGRLEGRVINKPDAVFDIRLPIVKQSCELQLFDYTESEQGELLLRFTIEPI